MEKAIEIVKARIQVHKETIESFYMNDTDFINGKYIRELNNLIREDEHILNLLTLSV